MVQISNIPLWIWIDIIIIVFLIFYFGYPLLDSGFKQIGEVFKS